MKKYIFFLLMVSFSVSSFGQALSEGLQAKNAGNDAYRKMEYVNAIKNWEKYLNSEEKIVAADSNTKALYTASHKYAANDFMKNNDFENALEYFKKYIELGGNEAKKDGKTAQMMGFCASKVKANDVALGYFKKSIELGYRPDASMLYIADIYKSAGAVDKMKTILIDALNKYPDSKLKPKLSAMLIVPLMKEAAEPFNAANKLAKDASDRAKMDYAGKEADYLKTMALAVVKFQEAIPMFERVLFFDPQNPDVPKYLANCKNNIRVFNEFKSTNEKNQ